MGEGTIEFGDENVRVIMPGGALGASSLDNEIDTRLRELAVMASTDVGEWAEKYGIEIDNPVFQMHPYCWCESVDCRWCSEDACGCEHPNPEAYLDGEQVTSWWETSEAILGPFQGGPLTPTELAEWDSRIAERNRRLVQVWPARVHSCEPVGLMTDRERGDTWLPSQSAPNFWHKPSGFKVWWYKYIGRSVEVWNVPDNLATVFNDCIEELARRDSNAGVGAN